MSLINEALKKAQKQQLDAATKGKGSPTTPPAPPPPTVPVAPPAAAPEPEPDPIFAARRPKKGSGLGKWTLVGFVFVIVGVGAVYLLRDDSDQPAATMASTSVAVNPAPPASADNGAPVEEADPANEPKSESEPSRKAPMEPKPSEPEPPRAVEVALPPSITVTPVPEPVPAPDPEPVATKPVAAAQSVAVSPVPAQRTASSKKTPQPQSQKATRDEPATSQPSSPPPAIVATASENPRATPTAPAQSSTASPIQNQPVGKVIIDTAPQRSATTLSKGETQFTSANDAVLNYLERARVTGIRVSATDPKVLMNNRVYRLNEIVDRDLQLRVVHIAPRELRFEDPRGHVYRKTF